MFLFLDDDDKLAGADAIVSGWGSTVEKGPPSNIPMKVSPSKIVLDTYIRTPGMNLRKGIPNFIMGKHLEARNGRSS